MEGLVKSAAVKAVKASEIHKYLKQNYPDDCIGWVKDIEWKEKKVPLSQIQMARRPGGAREMDKVKGIAEAVKQGKEMEPVVLVKTPEGKTKIADGYHRTLGHDHADEKTIKAWITEVPENKGPWDKEMHEKKLNVGKKAELDLGLAGLEKQASLLGLVGMGAAMHIAPNAVMKGVKSTKVGQHALAGTFSAGFDAGQNGMKLQPNFKNVMQYGIGPESLADYHLGRSLGQRVAQKTEGMSPERQERFMAKAKGMAQAHINSFENPEEVDKIPMLNSVKHYIEGHGENKVKAVFNKMSVPDEQAVNWKNRLGDIGMLGSAYAINPHLLIQPGLSLARKKLATSPLGQKTFEAGFNNGQNGKQISKPKELATDLLISPAVLDSYRMGKGMSESLTPEQNEMFKQNINVGDLYGKALVGNK